MSLMTEYNSRPEEVGDILIKVQEDLHQLRERLLAQQGDGATNVDLDSLDNAIRKTEEGIRNQTENVLRQLNNQVLTLPSLEVQRKHDTAGTLETPWDVRSAAMHLTQSRPDLSADHSLSRKPILALRRNKQTGQQLKGPTPGENFKQVHSMRVIFNPYNPRNREVMNKDYGIQLPLLVDKEAAKQSGKILTGTTVDTLAVLPRQNRVDPQLVPPPIQTSDAQKGILSLIERGLIPPAAELTLEPSPVNQKMAPLHDPQEKEDRVKALGITGQEQVNLASIRLDPSMMMRGEIDIPSRRTTRSGKSSRKGSGGQSKTPVTNRTGEMTIHPMPPPTTPASGNFKDQSHRFAIQHGRVRDQSQEFLNFKQHYCLSWGSIVTMVKHLERLLTNYAVPIAFINGDKLADLSVEFELEHIPSIESLLSVIVNREDVENLISRPGRRFVGPSGRDIAAAKIQATWKAYMERLRYLEYRRKKWAAGVIAISWVMTVKMAKVRKQLKATRADQLEAFRERNRTLARNWNRIKKMKRVVIHIPSLGYSQRIRDSINQFGIRQNTQMARLCDIKDPNVDVIYISPVQMNDEKLQYYSKLLGLKSAIDTGNVEDQQEITERYKIIVPEAINSFPAHRMCLSTHLKYSPEAINRIKNLIRGREAYIVTGYPHLDDVTLSDMLDVPVLSPDPEVCHLYSTKSGSKRVFVSAKVPIPPCEYDVYSLPQLHECLAQLVTENLPVKRWLFKLDDEFDGRGIAYCDIAEHLKIYPWAVKEAARYGEKWSKKWAQEAAYIKILAELPEVLDNYAVPVNTKTYPTWEKFIQAFLKHGGVVEACPPSDSITNLTVDMLIEPNGDVQIVSVGDQIHAETPLTCWGVSVPQSSVDPAVLNDMCMKIAESCKPRGVVGYFSIDFVTFIDPKSMEQVVWATDLSLCYTDTCAMSRLLEFTTGGKLLTDSHIFDTPPPKKEEPKRRRRRLAGQEEEAPVNTTRYAVMSTQLFHSNLAVVHYSVFFQMCRAHGIGYDVKEKQGTVFTLIDSMHRENLGMLSISDNLQGALATFARNLSVIHQEISAPNMQGDSNFKPVIEDIESILGITIQNEEEEKQTDQTAK